MDQYLKYLKTKLPNFEIELKTFTFSNFTYPIPIIERTYDLYESRGNHYYYYELTKKTNI